MNAKYIEGIVVDGVPIGFCEQIRLTFENGNYIRCKCCGCTSTILEVYFSDMNKSFDIPHRVIEKIEKIGIS